MNKLSRPQLDRIAQHIQQTNPHQALQAELLDHIASLIEQRMDQSQPFTDAFNQVIQQANPQAMNQLGQLYLNEFGVRSAALPTATRIRLRIKRRPEAKPFQYIFFSSLLSFLILLGFLIVVSRPLAIPMGAFRPAWGAGVLLSLLLSWWWLTRRLRKPKRALVA